MLTQEHINDLALGLKDFPDFIRQGIIEYLDVNEENNCFIALSLNTFEPKRSDFLPDSSNFTGFLPDASFNAWKRKVDIIFIFNIIPY